MRDVLLMDLGNVLVPFDYSRMSRAFSALTGLDEAGLRARITGQKLFDVCAGTLHPHAIFEELGVDRARATQAWCDIFTPDVEMIAFVDALAAKYRTYLWSNTDPLHWAFLEPHVTCARRFAGLHLSYELGAAKPQREYYLRALEKGGIDPSRAVFVDDVAENLAAAAQFGIATVQHRSLAETRAKLAELGFTP
jgi:putative hydrolase of the HAD superfamily